MKKQTILSLLGTFFLVVSHAVAQDKPDVSQLTPGKTIEREIIGGQTHSFLVTLRQGQFLRAVVTSNDIDVVATLYGPDGQKLLTVNLVKYPSPEPLSFAAEKAGEYKLEIRADAAAVVHGRYELTSEIKSEAQETDKQRLTAERLLLEANDLEREASKRSLQKAIDKHGEALVLWRGLGDKFWEAYSLHYSGRAASTLKKNQEALTFYNSALSIRKAIGDRFGEATTLNNIGVAYDDLGDKQKALEYYKQALPLRQATGDKGGQANTLANFGSVYSDLGQMEKALDYYNQALSLMHAIGDKGAEAGTLSRIGVVYSDLGQKEKALGYYNQALSLMRATGDKGAEASLLTLMGVAYSSLGQKQQALKFFSLALSLFRESKSRTDEAMTLRTMAFTYASLGRYQEALELQKVALVSYREMADKSGEAASLYGLALTYSMLGDNQRALEFLSLSLSMFRAVGDRSNEASSLLVFGLIYSQLSEYQKALEYYQQALEIAHAFPNISAQALALNNIGRVYESLGEWDKSLQYANRALPLWRELGDKQGEADTLNNLGSLYSARGEKQKALEFYNQALVLRRTIGDRRGEAKALNNIGFLYATQGEKQKALDYYAQALLFWRSIGDREGEATTLDNISATYEALGDKQKAKELHDQAVAIRTSIRPTEKPTLHILAIGIDQYQDANNSQADASKFPLVNLSTAVGDARNLAVALEASAKGAYDHVNTHLLLNSTRAEILVAFDKIIQEVRARDTVIFSYSGQGFVWKVSQTAVPEYYLMPADFNAEAGVSSGISATLLRTLFTKIEARRRLVVLDSPEGAVGLEALAKSVTEENSSLSGLLQRDVAFVSLSNGPRIDLVTGEGQGHGLLSYALLKGSSGPADIDGDGVSVRELANYARTYVKNRVPTIPNLDPALRRVEVRSFFAGEDFPLTSAQAATAKDNHARNRAYQWFGELTLSPNTRTQEPQPQKRSSEGVGTTDTALSRAPRARTGKDYALLIATNAYDHWSGLPNPVVDARAVEDELKNYYGFNTELLVNPTKAEIVAALKKYKNEIKYADDDQFFIFFAGHGTFVADFREGYIIARNSLKEDPDASSYLSHSQLRNIIDQIPCRHIFLVIDACFGGTFDEKIAGRGDGDDREREYEEATNLELINRRMRFETRQFLTSGGKEYVPDGRPGHHSPFARKLLEALRSYGGKYGIVTITRILSYVERVTPEPRRGEWGGNEPGSDFFFIVKPQ